MEIVIPTIIVIALLLLTTFTISEQSLASQEAITNSWREMQERMEERAQTDLSPVKAETAVLGNAVEITLRNDGNTKLTDFDRWDVILQYIDDDGYSHTEWYPFGSGQNEWTKTIDECIESGIFNPGEEIVIQVAVSPTVGTSTSNAATVATPNGISATAVFTH